MSDELRGGREGNDLLVCTRCEEVFFLGSSDARDFLRICSRECEEREVPSSDFEEGEAGPPWDDDDSEADQ